MAKTKKAPISKGFMRKNITNSSRRTKIAFVFNHPFFLGGGERSFFELIRSIDRERFEPIVIIPERGEIEEKCAEGEIQSFVASFPPLKDLLLGTPARALLDLIKLLKKINAEIIHVNGSRVGLYGGIAGRLLRVPVIWHVRETIQDLFFYDGTLASLAQAIICVSKSVHSKRFARFGKKINHKIAVVYNGVDTARFRKINEARQSLRKELKIKDETLFGIVGNIIPLKAHDFFLKGLGEAKERKPDIQVSVLIAGHVLDKSFDEKIRLIVSQMNMTRKIIFRPHSDEIAQVFSALDVFALPSRREGFSRSLLEAMSCGLPVLATKISEIEEAVVEGENAFLVNTGDEEAMANAIIRLTEDETIRKDMGERNRTRAVELFNLRRHAESVEMIYDSVLHRKS